MGYAQIVAHDGFDQFALRVDETPEQVLHWLVVLGRICGVQLQRQAYIHFELLFALEQSGQASRVYFEFCLESARFSIVHEVEVFARVLDCGHVLHEVVPVVGKRLIARIEVVVVVRFRLENVFNALTYKCI